jgi:hypothetical protein
MSHNSVRSSPLAVRWAARHPGTVRNLVLYGGWVGGDGRLATYVAGEGTRLFDCFPTSYRLDLVSSTPFSNGIVGLTYHRHR